VISSWVDFMMCEDDEVELSPELQELLVEITTNEEVEGSEAKPELSYQWQRSNETDTQKRRHSRK